MKLLKVAKVVKSVKADAKPMMKLLRVFRGDDIEEEEIALRREWARERDVVERIKYYEKKDKERDKLRDSFVKIFEKKTNSSVSPQELKEFTDALYSDILYLPDDFKNLRKKKKFLKQKGILVDDLINSFKPLVDGFMNKVKEIWKSIDIDMEKVNKKYEGLIEKLKLKDAKGKFASTLVSLARKFNGKVKGEQLTVKFTKSYKAEEDFMGRPVKADFSVYLDVEVKGDKVTLESNYNDQGGMEVTPQDEKITKSFKDEKELEKIVEPFIKKSIANVNEAVRYINKGQ